MRIGGGDPYLELKAQLQSLSYRQQGIREKTLAQQLENILDLIDELFQKQTTKQYLVQLSKMKNIMLPTNVNSYKQDALKALHILQQLKRLKNNPISQQDIMIQQSVKPKKSIKKLWNLFGLSN